MSFNHLRSDRAAYEQQLRESVSVGHYTLNTPVSDCKACFPTDSVYTESMPSSRCTNRNFTDISSELLGINRVASRAPATEVNNNLYCASARLNDCFAIHTEDTRLSNPPMTLRGTGWNRFEHLCRDPQATAIADFEMNV